MIKVAITLEGRPEEMASVLQFISGQQKEGVALNEQDSVVINQDEDEQLIWTERKIRAVYWGVSYTCRRLFREVANHENGITPLQLSKKLGLADERGVGGVLSSLGRLLKDPEYAGLQYPLDWITYGRYKMIPIWRGIIAKLVEEEGSIIGDNE